MKNKGLFLLTGIIIALFSITFIFAAPPFQTTTGADYLQILTPAWNVIKQNQDVDFYWHVFNTTNYLTNITVECTFHLYSIKEGGEHILSISDAKGFNNDRDFEVEVDGGNFTQIGEYRYLIECKTPRLKDQSYQVGGIEEAFEVTPSGEPSTTYSAIFYIGLLIILITFLIISLSKITSTENYGWVVGYVSISYFLLLSILFITYQVSLNFLTLIPYISNVLYITFLITLILMFPLFLIGIIYLLSKVANEREINKMIEMGHDKEEAKKFIKRR